MTKRILRKQAAQTGTRCGCGGMHDSGAGSAGMACAALNKLTDDVATDVSGRSPGREIERAGTRFTRSEMRSATLSSGKRLAYAHNPQDGTSVANSNACCSGFPRSRE